MDTQLLTLSKIFTERLFRIPDYQRGYAWTDKQLKDFWNDIQQLEHDHNHYTGVLTLENVNSQTYRQWEDDVWIIEAKSYQPYFVVDGQQRLTTAIILIQSILECIQPTEKLNFTEKADIQRRFIFDSKDDGISRSYVFGYEKDNPSYEFLKARVFCEKTGGPIEETVYTQNLARAKLFFTEQVSKLDRQELELLYRKVTQQLLFNIFTITEDVDVCVAFETMNNRGKPLSHLELLKNRLIYLSLKFDAPSYERTKLRRAINDCWKALYHNLGRNKENPLDDDRFLFTHYILYFGKTLVGDAVADEAMRYRRLYRMDYSSDLLERRFVPRNVMPDAPPETKVQLQDIYRYVSALQDAVVMWYKIWNPLDSDLQVDVRVWLDKLNRLGMPLFLPLVLAFLQKVSAESKRVAFLQVIERHVFVISLASKHLGYPYGFETDPQVYQWAIDLADGKATPEKVVKHIAEITDNLLIKGTFVRDIILRFRSDGFYNWDGIRYFLFEYNLELQNRSKTDRPKIFWPEFSEDRKDFLTIEHIYPRRALDRYWTSRFSGFSQKQRTALRNSLGNLLPLSKPKNSSLSNRPFPEKVEGRKDQIVGYRYGSYAENQVATQAEWTPTQILERGLELLDFMQRRWRLPLDSVAEKRKMLGLDFMDGKKGTTKASSVPRKARDRAPYGSADARRYA